MSPASRFCRVADERYHRASGVLPFFGQRNPADGNDNVWIFNFARSNSPIVELCGERSMRFIHLSACFSF